MKQMSNPTFQVRIRKVRVLDAVKLWKMSAISYLRDAI